MRNRSLSAVGGLAFLVVGSLALTVWTGYLVVRNMGPGGDGVVARIETADGVECMVTQTWNGWTEPYQVSFYSRPEGGEWGWCYIDHESMRWTSCSCPISRLKMADGVFSLIAAFAAMFSAKAVFPIEGRPAMITRSDLWKPDVILSRSTNPDGTPVTCCFLS